jgi:predicted hotdog family 3-hydroxylacyl-ACP dehydratase
MSGEPKKPRFGMLKGVRDSAEASSEAPVVQPVTLTSASVRKDDTTQEPFSCTLSRGMKRRLKKASADEDRKQYLLVEQALTEYLSRHHPDLN